MRPDVELALQGAAGSGTRSLTSVAGCAPRRRRAERADAKLNPRTPHRDFDIFRPPRARAPTFQHLFRKRNPPAFCPARERHRVRLRRVRRPGERLREVDGQDLREHVGARQRRCRSGTSRRRPRSSARLDPSAAVSTKTMPSRGRSIPSTTPFVLRSRIFMPETDPGVTPGRRDRLPKRDARPVLSGGDRDGDVPVCRPAPSGRTRGHDFGDRVGSRRRGPVNEKVPSAAGRRLRRRCPVPAPCSGGGS